MGLCWDYIGHCKLENMDEREQNTGPIGGDPYREVAGKLREVARECQLPPSAARNICGAVCDVARGADPFPLGHRIGH